MGHHRDGTREAADRFQGGEVGPCSTAASARSAPATRTRLHPRCSRYRDPRSAPNSRGWKVRVVPNKFPALQIEGDLTAPGTGIYDVVAASARTRFSSNRRNTTRSSPISRARTSRASVLGDPDPPHRSQSRLTLQLHSRVQESRGGGRRFSSSIRTSSSSPRRSFRSAAIEELEGPASLTSSRNAASSATSSSRSFDGQKRVILDERSYFLAIAPFAARFPFETWVLPRRHEPHFIAWAKTSPPRSWLAVLSSSCCAS